MLLQSLRRSHMLARLVLVWFVLAMGVAIAAPAVQPLDLGGICSATAAAGGNTPDGTASGTHHTLQCVLCLSAGAPPAAPVAAVEVFGGPDVLALVAPAGVVPAPRISPLVARAPPAR